jgi:BolA protein
VLVSEQFAGLNSVKRHQKVYATMGELMGESTPWPAHLHPEGGQVGVAPASPVCAGGTNLILYPW